MTSPYITVPFQGQTGFGAVTPSFGFVQQPSNIWGASNIWANPNAWATPNTWGIGVSNTIAQPQSINTMTVGQSSIAPTQFAPMSYGTTQQQATPSQVLAIVPYQSGTQSSMIAGSGLSQAQPLAIECSENQSEFVISFDVPGILAEDLDVSLTGNTVQINGLRKGTGEAGILNYSEISHGSFSRAIALPFEVSGDKSVNTSLENGVLKIRVNKLNQLERKGGNTRKMKIG
jgi:HSP20 family molecular chaperone IbpA